MNKRLFLFLVLGIFLSLTACGSQKVEANPTADAQATAYFATVTAAAPTKTPTPTRLEVKYVYKDVPFWDNLPKNEVFMQETVVFKKWLHPRVSLFDLEVNPLGGVGESTRACLSELGRNWSEPSNILNSIEYKLNGECEIQVNVSMAFCEDLGKKLNCRRGNLRVIIVKDDYISFMAKDSFSPTHREWLEELLEFLSSESELPSILEPDVNYRIDR